LADAACFVGMVVGLRPWSSLKPDAASACDLNGYTGLYHTGLDRGWGLREAAMAMLLGHLAVPGHSAFLSSVAFRLAKAASSLPGVLFLWGRLATLKGFLQGLCDSSEVTFTHYQLLADSK
jgi:hypothetical protein